MIGTSQEGPELHAEIDQAYEESLKENQKKVDDSNRLKDLMQRRKERLGPEPSLQDDHVVVRVHHPSLRNVSRLFFSNNKMMDVYHWVGSIHTEPEHFELLNFQRKVVYPDQTIVPGIFNIRGREEQI